MTEDDAFAVLQLLPSADWATIRAAYLVRARRWHPDVGGDAEQFARICTAYRVLQATEAAREALRRKCPDCGGVGQHEVRLGWRVVRKVPCGTCGGTGSV